MRPEQTAILARFIVEHYQGKQLPGSSCLIPCIKKLREITDFGLREAKDIIESVGKPQCDPIVATVERIARESELRTRYAEE